MALNLSTGGDFNPFIKYNAKAGRWFVRDAEGIEVEVANPRFALDLANIRTGWICFPQSGPPVFVWDYDGVRAPKPQPVGGNAFKDGFEVLLFGPDPQPVLRGKPLGLRQWTSNSNAAKAAIIRADKEYEAVAAQHPDEVPVFNCTGVTIVKGQNGDSFEPNLTLHSWVARSKLPLLTAAQANRQAANGHDHADAPSDDNSHRDLDDDLPF